MKWHALEELEVERGLELGGVYSVRFMGCGKFELVPELDPPGARSRDLRDARMVILIQYDSYGYAQPKSPPIPLNSVLVSLKLLARPETECRVLSGNA